MAEDSSVANRIVLGEHVPWFSAPLIGGGQFDLHVSAGRWVVLSFLGSPAHPRAAEELSRLLHQVLQGVQAQPGVEKATISAGTYFTSRSR